MRETGQRLHGISLYYWGQLQNKRLIVRKKDATPALRELMSREGDLTPHAQVTSGHHSGVTGETPAQQTRRASDAAMWS